MNIVVFIINNGWYFLLIIFTQSGYKKLLYYLHLETIFGGNVPIYKLLAPLYTLLIILPTIKV